MASRASTLRAMACTLGMWLVLTFLGLTSCLGMSSLTFAKLYWTEIGLVGDLGTSHEIEVLDRWMRLFSDYNG